LKKATLGVGVEKPVKSLKLALGDNDEIRVGCMRLSK
jgi:hypothetical protein